jgi:hypothetical protein
MQNFYQNLRKLTKKIKIDVVLIYFHDSYLLLFTRKLEYLKDNRLL